MPHRDPPLAVELSLEALAGCRRDPALAAAVNAIILRASRRLRACLADGGATIAVAGAREGITLHLRLSPPDHCRIERIEPKTDPAAASLSV